IRKVAPHIRTLSSFDSKSAERLGLRGGLKLLNECSDIIAFEKSLLAAQWEQIIEFLPLDRLGAWVPNDISYLEYWLAKPIRQITT
ncbi:glycerophosphodiester phosphodiesterase, partial [Rhizobium ruizarguesonis]